MDTIRKIGFTKVHTFPYSDRYGTPASEMSGKIDGNVKKRRVKEIIELSSELERKFYEKFYNRQLDVLFEEEKDGYFIGHTANFIKVKVKGNYKINEIFSVLLSSDNIII